MKEEEEIEVTVLLRGDWGERTASTLSSLGIKVKTIHLSESVPLIIEEPEGTVPPLNGDVAISYALHPQLNLEVVRMACEGGLEAAILVGGPSFLPPEAFEIANGSGVKILNPPLCCLMEDIDADTPALKKLIERAGLPILRVDVERGIVKNVKVLRSAPCGSTYYMAENLPGTPIDEAPQKASLLVSYYPCRAPSGKEKGIHTSSELHAEAIRRAIWHSPPHNTP